MSSMVQQESNEQYNSVGRHYVSRFWRVQVKIIDDYAVHGAQRTILDGPRISRDGECSPHHKKFIIKSTIRLTS